MAIPDDDPKRLGKKITINDLSGMRQRNSEVSDDVENTTEDMESMDDEAPETTADTKTDKAVDEIMKQDGDAALQAQDERAAKAAAATNKPGFWGRVKRCWTGWWASPRKRWGTIGVLVAAVVAVFAVPATRYSTLGLVLSADVTVRTVDSKSGKPVSGATVEMAGKRAETNAQGVAVLHAHLGKRQVSASKTYYKGTSRQEVVTLSANSNVFTLKLVATGRQVGVKLVDAISGKPLSGAVITSKGATAKTGTDGQATLVIDSGATTQEASFSLDGYNTATATITATGDLAKNTFKLTPAGKLYFLSNQSGHIDVVKTNLDGTDRHVVLEGTGGEDPNSTSLLASRNWKYLALLAKRSGERASVYLIDTTNGDLLTTVDEGNADFTLVGWSGERLIYQVNRLSVNNWQANKYALKSFDPTTGHTLLLDQTQGSGTSDTDYASQSFNRVYLLGSQVVYIKGWSGYGSGPLSSKQAEIDTIGADGGGHKSLKTFTPATPYAGYGYAIISISSQLYEPDGIYLWFADNGTDSFYKYENGAVAADSDMTPDKFWSKPYPTFLLSPSGNQTFWSESRDGKNTLFTGNSSGKSSKQVATLSEYSPYGWYSDDYLLVSKSASELYIMPAAGGTPVKITDYYKPAVSYYGYGGGYGGL